MIHACSFQQGKTLDSNDQNLVADQRFSVKQWFAGGAQSRGLRKPGCGHCYLGFSSTRCSMSVNWVACGMCYTKTEDTELGGIELQRSSKLFQLRRGGGGKWVM